jgi:inhibitor of cysteine peptidase
MRRWAVFLRCTFVCAMLVATNGVLAGQTGAAGGSPGAAGVTVVTEQTHGVVNLKTGAILEVRLEANHTTGYSWIAAPVSNPVLMMQGRAAYQENATAGKMGAGGVEVWRFKAVKAGRQGMQFEYRRPWEKGAPPAKVVMFNVTVE